MNQEKQQPPGDESHKALWIVVSIFIILAIGGMWAIDFYYSPESNDRSLSEAVGR